MKALASLALLAALGGTAAAADPLAPLAFLEGEWDAKTTGGAAGASTAGTYAFQRELRGHVLARRTVDKASCKGPSTFDCDHGDLLYVYEEAGALKAIYFDSEGHVIHYAVTEPSASKVVLVSEPAPGPRFRLTYSLENGAMTGTFELQPPGRSDWKPYLSWTGARHAAK